MKGPQNFNYQVLKFPGQALSLPVQVLKSRTGRQILCWQLDYNFCEKSK